MRASIMRRRLIVGNWKLNGSVDSITQLLSEFNSNINTKNDVAVCAPHIYIPLVESLLVGELLRFGAQDVSAHISGAYTGEVSASMLRQYSCSYCLVGHSERRTMHQESNIQVAAKFKQLLSENVTPILCLGESLAERKKEVTESIIEQQLVSVINECGIEAMRNTVIAYEPVWAIGSGITASPEQAQKVHAFIRNVLGQFEESIAESIQVIYGGSMNPSNAATLLAMPDIDGGLVGGASLKPADFLAICHVE